ncbi:MAG: RNA polymerase subunit sigma-24 [Planctomycetaceae bacterium]|nr:RNA polymerase subunit sigma-24 [Planctomycetaceae bacterium]
MADANLDTIVLQECLDRWRAGEREAADELLRMARVRLEKLARRMTRSFPNVRCMVDEEDILQSSLMRFLRTLQTLCPTSTRDFFNLAAVHIRRELLDLARRNRYTRTIQLESADSGITSPPEPTAPDDNDPESERWVRFHEAVENLPVEEREVVGLVFYHGWKQDKIAELFQVDERTIRRRWASACQRLRQLTGTFPE